MRKPIFQKHQLSSCFPNQTKYIKRREEIILSLDDMILSKAVMTIKNNYFLSENCTIETYWIYNLCDDDESRDLREY